MKRKRENLNEVVANKLLLETSTSRRTYLDLLRTVVLQWEGDEDDVPRYRPRLFVSLNDKDDDLLISCFEDDVNALPEETFCVQFGDRLYYDVAEFRDGRYVICNLRVKRRDD